MSDPGTPEPIERRSFGAAHLMASYPPRWSHPNKVAVYEIACPPGSRFAGTLDYSRWAAMPLPERVDPGAAVERVRHVPGFYDYAPAAADPSAAVEWHVNFADPNLFVAYSSPLFAQDEMQVSEHPVLGALREALGAAGLVPRTVVGGSPTPILITNAERRCRVATEPDASAGRPEGLYGNAFARAPIEVVRAATERIDPPTLTNLIAMAAPRPASGRYAELQIREALVAASTGFRAAVLESARMMGAAPDVIVHTGFWGCGAFGGNRVLMTVLQALAAELASVDLVVFHVGDPSGAAAIEEARLTLRELGDGSPRPTDEVIGDLVGMGFLWGVSDGN